MAHYGCERSETTPYSLLVSLPQIHMVGWDGGNSNIKYNCVNKHEAIYRNYYYNNSNKKKIIFIINI